MKSSWKRLLALLLTMAMVLSLGAVGYAADDEIVIVDPEDTTAQPEPVTEGTQLELEELDAGTLGIHKLGEETEEEGGIALVETEGEESAAAFDPDEIVRVSIFLEDPSTLDAGYSMRGVGTNSAAIAYRDSLRAQQDAMTARIESVTGQTLDVQWNLTLATNAISAYVRVGDMNAISKIPGVRAVVRENLYEAYSDEVAYPETANTSENMVGATAAWAAGYTGAGSRIAIIDTGIDTTHQSFAEEPFTYAVGLAGATAELMTRAQVQNLASQLNSKSSNYVSAKIPYGYNYVDKNTTINHLNDTGSEHGSHVAGIAAANRFIGSAHNDAASTVGAVGMAPDAQLFVMKVFGAAGGAYDSDYMVALEDAIVLDCDVANLSLGSAVQGWTFDDTYQDILNNLVNKAHNEGMVVSISAGNAYDFAKQTASGNLYRDDIYYHTGGSPGSFVNSLCVAAAQNTLTTGTPMQFNGSQDVYYYESTGNEEEGTTYSNPALTTIAGSYSYVYIDSVGSAEDYSAINSAINLSGKVVIVNRGSISFVEKGNNAKSYSPKAVIVANNQEGTIYMDLTDFTGTFPMVTITQKDANRIKEGATEHTANGITYYTGSMKVTDTEKTVVFDRSEATISDFSSWGVPGSLLMKPEITAPGGDIYSVAGTYKTTSGGTDGGSDKYEYMSGTSMAAPHITGLTAVLAEYLRENPISARNAELNANYSTRAIIQSLLMSTATPMRPDNEYLPILQQGAGLADVSKAISASSVLMMNEAGLTSKTGANADGKVKVELGDDPSLKGEYSYSFTLYNLRDVDLSYTLNTDLFTQKVNGDFVTRGTVLLPAGGVSYTWNGAAATPVLDGHDVDRDGDTDEADAQAILDYLAEKYTEEELDLEAADLDGDGEVTTYDAHLLLNWEPEEGTPAGGYVLPANGKAEVIVTISLTEAQRSYLEETFPRGAYLEGFTYVSCTTSTREAESLAHTHTIPVLGFYGSWTGPSMFDNMSYVDGLYGAERLAYSGTADTNYLMVNYNGSNIKFSGNPYMIEDEFPADRLALNANTNLIRISYNMVRAAATTGYAVTKLDENGLVSSIVTSSVTGNSVNGLFWTPTGGWQNTGTKIHSINKTVASYGLSEGEHFRLGFYAIPEYYGMIVNDSYNESESGLLNQGGFNTLLTENILGKGALVGYDFVVDNREPVIDQALLSGNTITVHVTDNENLAYVAVLSLDGSVKYAEAAPGSNEYSITFAAADAIANAYGYVAVFAGDYAGNEVARAVRVNDNTHVEKTVYVLTNTLTAGNDYLIVNTNTPGSGYSLYYTLNASGTTATTGANAVTVKAGNGDTGNKPYIESVDAASTAVWTAGTGSTSGTYFFGNNGWYLRRSNTNNLTITKDTSRRDWNWDGTNNRLSINSRYLRYYNNTFSLNTATNSVYLFVKTEINVEIDPYNVTGITVTPSSLELYKGNTAELVAKVTPITAEDRTVTWSSSNNSIATVDANGHVTAVAAGTATITATANGNSAVSASCTLTVVAVNKQLNGIVWDEQGGVYFSGFNASSLPTWTKLHNDDKALELHSAFMQSGTVLYAATLEGSSLNSTMYSVNRSSYALTTVGEMFVGAMDMTRGVTNTTYASYAGMVYCFGPYIVAGNYTSSSVDLNDGTTFTGVGIPYGLTDLSETTGAYIAGVAAKTIGATSSTYYVLDENGVIWQTTLSYSSSDGFVFSTPSKVMETGISTSFLYQSLYYDGTWLYWGHQTDDTAELIIMNPSTGKVYHAGNFGDNIWPVVGLYVNGSVPPASVEEEVPVTLDLKPVATREELLTREVCERFGIPYTGTETIAPEYEIIEMEETGEETEIIEIEPYGTINAFRDTASVMSTDTDAETDETGKVVITISEDSVSTNGYITLTYDPELMTLNTQETTSSLAHYAFLLDEEKGIVSFYYANKDELPASTVLAQVVLTTACEDTEIVVETWEHNDEVELAEDETVIVSGTGHKWGEPTWTWAEDFSTATATFVCENVAEHEEEKEAAVTSKTTAAACEQAGLTTYTATVEFNGKTYTDTRTTEIPAIGHDYGEPTYTWAADNSSVTAETVCAHDASHKITETVNTTAETTDPTCTQAGKTVYTATFTNEAFETQTREVVIEATGHTPGEPVIENEVAASCETDGSYDEVVYCTVCHEELSRETKTVPATGHAYGEPTYTWAADNSSVTAEAVCTHDASHKITETVDTTYAVITEPTTEAEGLGRYTASFENEAFETQTKDVVLPKLEATGYHIIVADYTKGTAVTSLVAEQLYSGEVTFTVSSNEADAPVGVALVNADGSLTRLSCTTADGVHSFTVSVADADVTIALVLKGDFDLNGRVSTKDSTAVKQTLVELKELNPETAALQIFAVDLNNDGALQNKEATMIAQVLVDSRVYTW